LNGAGHDNLPWFDSQGDKMPYSVKTAIRCAEAIIIFLCTISMSVPLVAQSPAAPAKSTPAGPAKAAPAKAAAPAAVKEEPVPTLPPNALFPAVVARINGKPIPGIDLERQIRAELAAIGSPEWKNLREDYRQQLIDQYMQSLITSELIYQKAVASGIKAVDEEVQAELAKVSKNFSSDAEMNATLADRGLDRQELIRDLTKSLVSSKYVDQNITGKITATPEEAAKYYSNNTEEFRHPEMVRISHILFIVPDGASADRDSQIKQRAAGILARIKKGEDFAKLAKDNSMDASSSQGGDIGYFAKEDVANQFGEAIFLLAVGRLSEVTRTNAGYHIIKVTDRRQAGLSTLQEIQDQLIDYLKNQKADAELQKLVQQLASQAKIEVLIPVSSSQKVPADSAPRP
jgi:peptidyl-prolyl cis-trans isomerase C